MILSWQQNSNFGVVCVRVCVRVSSPVCICDCLVFSSVFGGFTAPAVYNSVRFDG